MQQPADHVTTDWKEQELAHIPDDASHKKIDEPIHLGIVAGGCRCVK